MITFTATHVQSFVKSATIPLSLTTLAPVNRRSSNASMLSTTACGKTTSNTITMKALFLFLIINSGLHIAAQDTGLARLNAYFDTLEKHQRFMGNVAVMKEGNIVYARSIGYRDVAANARADVNTKYRIGSINKTFTAVLIMMAVEEKKLRLETTLDTFYPSIPQAANITIAHLLSHRSGIWNVTDDSLYLQWHTQKQSEAQLLERMIARSPLFAPGSKAAYSNSNYILLTRILEKIYQQPYAQLLQAKIIKPLGLKHTHAGGRINPVANEAYSYRYADGWVKEEETDSSIPLGAGAMVSTPTDILTFAHALFNGKLISAESLEQMKKVQDNFGRGLFIIPFYNKRAYGHTGGIDGFNAVFAYFPEEKIGYALTGNGTRMEINQISITVLSWVFQRPFTLPSFKQIDIPIAEMERYTGSYKSQQLPLKITVTRKGNTLMAQAEGQSAFTLEAEDRHIFRFQPAGLTMEFYPEENKMVLKQRGAVFTYYKIP